MTKIEIIHSIDEDYEPIVTINLTNSDKKAVLYQEDLNNLIEEGLDPRWKISENRVLQRGKKKIPIARLVADAKAGERIQYQDKNPLNLKRNNLIVGKGAGKHHTVKNLSPINYRKYEHLKQKGELTHTKIAPPHLQGLTIND